MRRNGRGEVQYRVQCARGTLYVRERAAADRDGTVVGVIEDVGSEHERLLRAETIERLLIELEEHLYTGWFDGDGTYHETYQSPNGDHLLGGAEADENAENWMAAVHPEDKASYEVFMAAQVAGENASVEYRLCGADGVTRWMRERSKSQQLPTGAIEVIGIATDISSSRAAAAALAASEAKLEHVLKAVDAYVYVLEGDEDGGWRTISSSATREKFMGGKRDARRALAQRVVRAHPPRRPRSGAAPGRGLRERHAVRGVLPPGRLRRRRALGARPERAVRGRRGPQAPARSGARRQRPAPARAAAASSVDQLRSANAELRQLRVQAEQQARTDVVTGAHNRLALSEHVALALESRARRRTGAARPRPFQADQRRARPRRRRPRARRGRPPPARGRASRDDCVARWGGEEFAVLFREVGDECGLAQRAVHLQRAIDSRPIVVDGEHLTVEVSGGATPLKAGESLDALVEHADRALYAAKRRGRNRVLLASEITENDLIAERPEAIRIAEALAVAVGVREGAPPEHPALVASLAARIARSLHLDSRTALRCELGGWLHDIGKLSVPERVLLKPMMLDAEEWEIMRGHPELGEQIVERIPALHAAGPAIRHHHERFDGGGYPDGLAGSAIPIEARIVAVADTFSAMTQIRPYATPRAAETTPCSSCAAARARSSIPRSSPRSRHVLAAEDADALPRAA